MKKVYGFDHRDYKINKDHKDQFCRIAELDKPCKLVAKVRGLCFKHKSKFKNWDVFEEYATPLPDYSFKNIYKVAKEFEMGICPIIEKGKKCQGVARTLRLCTRHYQYFRYHGKLNKYKVPIAKHKKIDIKRFKIKPTKSDKVCRISYDGKLCKNKIHSVGLCKKHYSYFYNVEMLHEFGDY